jgi:predicted nucleic acid-binding protein
LSSAFADIGRFRQPSAVALLHARELHLSRGVSFWDAMILGACVDAKVEILYTQDLSAASISSPRLINPFV